MQTAGSRARGAAIFSLHLDQRRLARETEAFLRRRAPAAVDKAVRKIAFDVVSETVRALNGAEAGYPAPKRIDTGRFRAAWATGAKAATGLDAGSTAVGPSRTGTPNPPQAGDGTGSKSGEGLRQTITVANNVEYGPHIEYGTATMQAGHHLALGIAKARRGIRRMLAEKLKEAW